MAAPPKIPRQPNPAQGDAGIAEQPIRRIKSTDLLQQRREIEIEHMGRIYRLRVTQHNKLILTA